MLPRTSLLAVTTALAATALIPSSALAVNEGQNLLQSRSDGLAAFPGGGVNASSMGRFAANENGCRVVFQSSSDGLMTGDNDRVQNIYVRDTCGDQDRLVLISAVPGGVTADADSSGAAISPNGRYVAFGTRATNLGGGDVPNAVYRYDLQDKKLVAVSRTAAGAVASGILHATPSVASTGDVAFTTAAALDPDRDKNGTEDVYVATVAPDGAVTTKLVSRGPGETDGATGGTDPSISADGWVVGFTSAAGIAGTLDTNGANDVYRRTSDETTLVSRSASGAVGGRLAALDNDGSDIAFVAAASAALDPKDTNGKQDVYRWKSDGTMTLVSRLDGAASAAPNGTSSNPSISATGNVVSFASDATDLTTPAQTGTSFDVFRRDLAANTTTIMSRIGTGGADFSEGATTHAMSTDGSHEVMLTGSDNVTDLDEDDVAQIFSRTVSDGGLRHVNRPPGTAAFTNRGVGVSTSGEGATSADGRFVAFLSEGNGLVDGDNDGLVNVYVRDNQTNTTEQVNVTSDERQGTAHSSEVAISGDGRRVAFVTRASLSPDDLDSQGSNADVYVRDRQTGETILVSRPAGTGRVSDTSGHYAEEVAISGDGTRVAFSTALALSPADTNGRRDVYVREVGGQERLWLVTPGTAGEDPTFGSMKPVLDRDGSTVAFVTPERLDATNDPVAGRKDVYVRDLDSGTVELVSRGDGADTAAGGSESLNPSISADGNRIAFESRSQVSPGSNGQLLVHLRDRVQKTTLLVSRGPGFGGAVPNAAVTRPTISADGKRVAYQTAATNATNGETPLGGFQHVWMRNLATGGTTLVSRFGAGGVPGTGDSTAPSLSPNGRCVAFTSMASNIGLEHATGDYSQVWLRGVTGSCPDVIAPITTIGGPEGPTQNKNPQFFLSANEDGVTFECKVGDGEWSACKSPLALTNLADGDYTVSVRATDMAGNVESSVKTRSFTVDTTKPVVSWTDPIDSVTGDATPTVGFASDEAGVEFLCQIDGEDVDPCASPLTLGPLSEGSHELTVRARDGAGNISTMLTAEFEVDLTGAVAEITGGPASTTADTTPQFTFASEDGSTFRCGMDTTQLSACTSPWTSAALAEGAHTFRVQAIDPHGTPGPVVERTFTVDVPDPKPEPKPEPPAGGGTPPGGSVPSTSTPRGAGPSAQGGGAAPKSSVRLAVRSAKIKRGRVTLSIACSGADCRGSAVLKAKVGRKIVVLGRASYRVNAGRTAKVTVKLTAAGRKALRKGKRLKATVDLGGTPASLTLRG